MDLFNLGMQREYNEILEDFDPIKYRVVNLGPGNKTIPFTEELEYPEWNAETDPLPYPSRTVAQIHAYHFLEHIQNIVPLMQEMRRVLLPGGHINIVVPYYLGAMAHTDVDHKRTFSEKIWTNLFQNKDYSKGKVEYMEIATNMIMGDRLENLCLVTQLRKPLV
jgi:SAM-dependent methyltransferase